MNHVKKVNFIKYFSLVLTISLLITSCTKSPTSKWSFSFDINGQNHKGSGNTINGSLVESCSFDTSSRTLNISWGSLTQPEQLIIKFPSISVGKYIVNNNTSWISYSYVAGNLLGYSSIGDQIEITSITNDDISGVFNGRLGSYTFTNGRFKALRR
jgi:hypothetical protein